MQPFHRALLGRGYKAYVALNESVMIDKTPWLSEVLREKSVRVLIYNGNLDVIVHLKGTSELIRRLDWEGKKSFDESQKRSFLVWNEDERVRTFNGDKCCDKLCQINELAGHWVSGGGLTFLVVRNAGHMVPISQPRWARALAREFVKRKEEGERFSDPPQMKPPLTHSALKFC